MAPIPVLSLVKVWKPNVSNLNSINYVLPEPIMEEHDKELRKMGRAQTSSPNIR